jgi:hypothetical protein
MSRYVSRRFVDRIGSTHRVEINAKQERIPSNLSDHIAEKETYWTNRHIISDISPVDLTTDNTGVVESTQPTSNLIKDTENTTLAADPRFVNFNPVTYSLGEITCTQTHPQICR